MLTELDAVNELLGTLGETPLNDLDDDHPLVDVALNTIRLCASRIQVQRWWFNVEYATLFPDPVTGHIRVPNDTASVDTMTQRPRVGLRGTRLVNLDRGSDTFQQPVRVRLHRDIPYADCPPSVRAYATAMAKKQFHQAYDGDAAKLNQFEIEEQRSYALMNTEHIRNVQANILNTRSVRRLVMSIGPCIGGRL